MATATPKLERLMTDLSDPAAYPHPVKSVRVVQTHISCVFLTGEFAYKIKKPVDFGFLDYRTLTQRRMFCEHEISLNRRLCPELYLELVPITHDGDRCQVGGSGTVVEWAVKMRQLREENLLSARLEAGVSTGSDIERVANILASFHSRSATGPDIAEWGLHSVVSRTVFNALQTMDTLAADVVSLGARTAIRTHLKSFLDNEHDLFCSRANEECVRDCHGDLRTQNICFDPRFDGGVQIFDCIEFNKEFRYIDVAADLAYLAMDLDLAGRADLREMLVDAYTRARSDPSICRILPFYQTYRACVRGNIALFAAREGEIPELERELHRTIASAVYDLARCYACKRPDPALLITVGFSGCGKSSLARETARRLPAVLLSSDDIRKERAGVGRTVRLNESRYSSMERAEVYAELYRRGAFHLARGENVLLDATFLSAAERTAAHQLAKGHDAEFWMLECQCPDEIIRRRLAQRSKDANVSDAGVKIYEQQVRDFADVELPSGSHVAKQFHVVVDTDGSARDVANKVVDRFASP